MRKAQISESIQAIGAAIRIVCIILAFTAVRAAAFSGDTIADRELGQPDFFHNSANTPDADVFNAPVQIAIDRTSNRLYVADSQNSRVLGYHSVAALVTGAPADLVVGQRDLYSAGCNIPVLSLASLCNPTGVAVDGAGNLLVADNNNHRVLEYTSPFTTMINTGRTGNFFPKLVIGQGGSFRSNNCNMGGPPSAATLCNPTAVAIDTHGNLFVSDSANNRVLEYNAPLASSSTAAHVFGQGGSFVSNTANKGGVGAASLNAPEGLAVDAVSNSLYVADSVNSRVLRFSTPLTSQTANLVFGQSGSFTQNNCNTGGVLNANSLCGGLFSFIDVTVDSAGNVYIADFGNNRLLLFNPPFGANPKANVVFGQSTFTSNSCNRGLPPSATSLCNPAGAVVDSSKKLWVSDLQNHRVLSFTPPFTATPPSAGVVLGQPDAIHNSPNSVDPAGLNNPAGIAIDRSSLPNHLYVADYSNNRILGYKDAASFADYAPADIVIGQADFYSSQCNQNIPEAANTLCNPQGLAVDKSGNLFVADFSNNRVLKFSAPFNSGHITNQAAGVVFGQAGSFTTHNSTTTSNGLSGPVAVAFDSTGKLYVVDNFNSRVLQYVPPFPANPGASLVIGQSTFTAGNCNRGGPTSSATLCGPLGAALDAAGNLYVADANNSRVLEYNAPLATGKAATRVLGQGGSFTANQCDDTGLDADSLCDPQGVGFDLLGNLYVVDNSANAGRNNRVLEYNTPLQKTGIPGSGDLTADMVFGQADDFSSNLCNFGGTLPSPDTLCNPMSVAFDVFNNLYVSDYFNNRVVEYDVP